MSHASDERHQRELAANKRFRGNDLDNVITTYFGGEAHPDLGTWHCTYDTGTW